MKTRFPITTIILLGCLVAVAQNVAEEPQADPVLDAIQKFQNRDPEKPNEVFVVLDPVQEEPEPDKSPAAAAHATPPDQEPTEPAKPENELTVRVESLHTGKGVIDPAQVKLLAPFAAKPLAQPPAGWRLDASDSAPPFTREVEISPGSKITLTIRPHLLIPDADGAEIFTISEPGYDNILGYQQTATVGAILSNSIRQLDEESKQLGTAIDNLQQLLVSLPKPAPQPEPEAKPAINRKR